MTETKQIVDTLIQRVILELVRKLLDAGEAKAAAILLEVKPSDL